MLDVECFTYLNRALESPLAPVVVFATNRGVCEIRGTDVLSPHGLPVDLLDRLVLVRTLPYTPAELTRIVAVRAGVEGLTLTPEALAALGAVGGRASLRHAVQLLTPAAVVAKAAGRLGAVTKEDVDEVDGVFFDAKASARLLAAEADRYVAG